jgi:hypothetical protein
MKISQKKPFKEQKKLMFVSAKSTVPKLFTFKKISHTLFEKKLPFSL